MKKCLFFIFAVLLVVCVCILIIVCRERSIPGVKILEIDTNDVTYVKWYGFNEKEYYINNREDINNFIETLKNHNYIKKQDNDAEGCYLVEIGCSNGIIDCGIDDDLFSINGVQYSLEEGSLSALTEYMRSKMD